MATGLSQDAAPPRPAGEAPDRRARRRAKHPVVTVVVLAVVLVIAAVVGWIGLRGYLARQQLTTAVPAAQSVMDAVGKGDLAQARTAAKELKDSAATAASLTGDPIWRAAEIVPWVGPNLAAVRTAAAATDTVASRVIAPLVSVASDADPRTIAVKNGKVDLAPLVAAQPVVEQAQAAFHRAQADVDTVDASATLPPIHRALDRLRSLFGKTEPTIDAIGNAARLLPAMLGAEGPRNYLVVAQNPAELRATGGLIGSVSLIHTDKGSITLPALKPGTTIGPWDTAVAKVPDATSGLYGPLVGRYLQDANLTPDFPLAASTVSAMWTKTYGGTVDGVIALDPVALSEILRATGPVTLSSGETLAAGDAVQVLLSDVYRRFSEPWRQDAFFSSSAAAVFRKVAGGGVDGTAFIASLARVGDARRVLLWSAHPAEQKVLAATTLAGELPTSTTKTAGIGVYFDDATGAKMDYYLSTKVAAGAAVCRADGKPTAVIQVTLTSRAPADAATSLPPYVTGNSASGVPAGTIRTRVAVYGPAGGLLAATTSSGTAYPTVSGTDRSRPVSVFTVDLTPGESKTVSVEFLNAKQTAPGLSVSVAPTLPGDGTPPVVGPPPPAAPLAVPCSGALK